MVKGSLEIELHLVFFSKPNMNRRNQETSIDQRKLLKFLQGVSNNNINLFVARLKDMM